ncbi:MAG TPA: hypothetical protein VKB32_03440 [Actinomycetota bacterium]|nr:hypothetical protein [Actinomycetota bacterium]
MRHRAGAIALVSTVPTLLLVVATAALLTVDGAIGGDPVSNVLALVAMSCYAVVGGLIAARLPGNACGWLLLLIGFGLVVSMGAEAASTVALEDGRLELAQWALWVNSWLLVAVVWPGIVLAAGGRGVAGNRPVHARVPDRSHAIAPVAACRRRCPRFGGPRCRRADGADL